MFQVQRALITSNRILKGGVVIPLIFPKVPQSSQTESWTEPYKAEAL